MVDPYILGLFHGSSCRAYSMESGRVRAIAAETLLRGAILGLFGSADIDFETETIRYMRMTADGWTAWQGPFPDVVLSGEVDEPPADCPKFARLRTLAPCMGQARPEMLVVSTALQSTDLAPHVIPFRDVASARAGEAIASFLDAYPRAVLKPATHTAVSKASGNDTTFIACDGDDIVVRRNDQHWRSPREAGVTRLLSLVGDQRWIVQEMIVSRVRDGRTFDVKIHTHKDGRGNWALVRSYVGLSEAGKLAPHSSRGGFQGDLGKVLANLGDDSVVLAARIKRLGLQVSETLDSEYDGSLDELGISILIDPEQRPWIAGVTARPASHFHEYDRARPRVGYALHLAYRFRPESLQNSSSTPRG